MRCPKCQSLMVDNKCTACGSKFINGSTNKVGFYSEQLCCVCGNAKAKGKEYTINKGLRDAQKVCYCFWCAAEKDRREFNSLPKTYETKEAADYHNALTHHYLLPLFYNQEPNFKLVDTLGRKMLNAEIAADKITVKELFQNKNVQEMVSDIAKEKRSVINI